MRASIPATRDQDSVASSVERFFTKNLSRYDEGIVWEKRTARITDTTGKVVFEQHDVEAPSTWSQIAVDIAASKYFRKAGVPGTGRETSVRQLIERVAGSISEQAAAQGLVASSAGAAVLSAELSYLLVHQYAAFNSPVWFNAGLGSVYGVTGTAGGNFRYDRQAGQAVETEDAYSYPALSACFIQSVDDTLMGIADAVKREMRVFKGGGGSGMNFSSLRAEGEPLSGGGKSSGVMSFLDIFDKAAGATKSGGTTRRAARMVVLDVDHPDIETFIDWKVREEEKVRALIARGYSSDFNGDAYRTIGGQNANNSVRVTDDFMRAVVSDGKWTTTFRKTGAPAKTYKARDIMRKIAKAAHACADPGMQFDTTCNEWHTVPNTGRINGSNPCQPAWATVLTPKGITTLSEVGPGDYIWSGSRWTKITKKWSTGAKEVYAYKTRAGVFYGTENHRVVQHGEKIEVGFADAIDAAVCVDDDRQEMRGAVCPRDVMDGLVFGDGMVHKASKNLPPLLCVGQDDHDYLESEVRHLFVEDRFALSPFAWAVETTITRDELPKTYERKVPERFEQATAIKMRGFLRGLYSANGSVINGASGARVTLKAASFDVIESVQRMLSALGIRSYYTTNKSKSVEFDNGIYECRQSYDLNVSTDRARFQTLIGFVQPDKQKRLATACQRPVCEARSKTTYEIVEREFVAKEEVFDLTVEAEEHTYWTGGLLVSNCSEYMHVDNSACNLASLNLVKFLDDDGTFNVTRFIKAINVFITAMDAIVDYASYPTKEIAENSHRLRPLGLGYANLGALLMRLGLSYDSEGGRLICSLLTALMTGQAYKQSAVLASHVGPFAHFAFNREAMLAVMEKHHRAIDSLDETSQIDDSTRALASTIKAVAHDSWVSAREIGRRHGYRNAQATVLAPTGTIGLLMDCDTTGIEPDFALVKFKKLAGGGNMKITNGSVAPALDHLGYSAEQIDEIVKHVEKNDTIEGAPWLKPEHLSVFDCAVKCGATGKRFLSPTSHIKMMAAAQPFLSGAISKTINCPYETTVEEIEQLFVDSWKLGLKAVAVYREGSKACAVLSGKADESDKKSDDDDVLSNITVKQLKSAVKDVVRDARPERRRLPKRRSGFTQEVSIAQQKLYLRTGEYEDGSLGEIFLDMHKQGSTTRALLNSFAILTSIALQHGVPLEEIASAFVHTKFEPRGMTFGDPDVRISSSLLDYVFRTLSIRYLGRSDLRTGGDQDAPSDQKAVNGSKPVEIAVGSPAPGPRVDVKSVEICAQCGDSMIRSGSCFRCNNCGSTSGCS